MLHYYVEFYSNLKNIAENELYSHRKLIINKQMHKTKFLPVKCD